MRETVSTLEAAKLIGASRKVAIKGFDQGLFDGYRDPKTGYRRIYKDSLSEYISQYQEAIREPIEGSMERWGNKFCWRPKDI